MTTMVIEGLLIFLLMVTIGYCYVLDQRLKVLRNGQKDLRSVINDLVQTTHTAQQAIVGLRATADDVDQKLSAKLEEARVLTDQLGQSSATQQPLVYLNNPTAKSEIKKNQPASPIPSGNAIFLSKTG